MPIETDSPVAVEGADDSSFTARPSETVHETEAQNEIVPQDGQMELSDEDAMAQYIANRKEADPELFGLEATSSEDVVEEQEFTTENTEETEVEEESADPDETGSEADEPEETPLTELSGSAVRKFLAKEAALRTREEAIKAREAELEGRLTATKKSEATAENVRLDPVSFLRELGFTEKEFADLAETLSYESLGDLAPDDYVEKRRISKLERELAELKRGKEQVTEDPQDVPPPLAEYQQAMVEQAKSFNPTDYPIMKQAVDLYGEMAVAADMFGIAQSHAEEVRYVGPALTPAEAVDRLEQVYIENAERLNLRLPEKTEEAAPARKKKGPKSLRNNIQKMAPAKQSVEGLSPEDERELYRRNFDQKLKELGFLE